MNAMHALLAIGVFVVWPVVAVLEIIRESRHPQKGRHPRDYEQSNW